MLAWIKPISVGTVPTHYKTPTIQVQAQKKPPYKAKTCIRFVVIPYTQGIAESFKKICSKYGKQTYFKGNITIKQLCMKPKDQDPKDQEGWGNIQFPMCGHCLQWGVHRGNIKDPGGVVKRAPKTTLSHLCAHTTNRTQPHSQQFQHHWEGGPGTGQGHQGSHLHMGKQSNIKQEYW